MTDEKVKSAIFITFSGNCKKALTLYQCCFGGNLQFEYFDKPLAGFKELPVVNGSLIADSIAIYGSDLVHDEGRKIGNHLSIFMHCNKYIERLFYLQKLSTHKQHCSPKKYVEQKLIEITDPFGVKWLFGL